jgi:uncharacterized membrane protein YccC
MSDVISFRLDKENPREEKARQVLKYWYEEGYSLRYIMTEALLRLDEPHVDQTEEATLGEVSEKLNRISQMLEQIGNGQSIEIRKAVRLAPNLPEKLERQRELRKLETRRDEAWRNYDQASREIDRQKDTLLYEISHRLEQHIVQENLLIIHWSIK